MKRLITRAVIAGLFCGSAFGALFIGQVASADDAAQPAVEADHSLLDALGKTDEAAAGKLLDTNFVWTDVDGKTRKKAEVLGDLPAYAADNKGDEDVQTHFYGQVVTVIGAHHDARFLRIWVKRPAGWREFLEIDTPMAPKSSTATVVREEGKGDCENPCRTVPYKPTTAMDKAILADWQKTKVEEWHPDAKDWPTHIADEFLIINNASMRDKPQRVAIAEKQQASGIGAPGAPITSMEIHDFGDNAAVMISHHVPYRGGKPYYNVRVWTLRDGRWQLAISQQTTIQAAAPVPPVEKK